MIREWIAGRAGKHVFRGIPVIQLLIAAQVAILAGQHLGKLEPDERRLLLDLLVKARGRPSKLSPHDHGQLHALVAKLEPRLFAGSAVAKASPLPIPKRILYGSKNNPARQAAETQTG